ncbi:hypothetical protein B0H15DRAFT_772501 [Mycena belliarum]|uniref:Uncharacterized protein n=1 Tax=Mycena belliarum TaxID=1033014 RepID=A0AAD6UIJ0_9AGAR|nr:hypothetical protein B0H15DRAFT_772501 [Mycena belliae]
MSSAAYLPVALNVTGFFSLSNGVRVQSQRGGWHNKYTTAISCLSGKAVNADLRVYSPPGDEPVKNGTIVFVVAKASFPSNASAIMDAAHFAPFPGDPAALDYEDAIPDFTVPSINGLGHIQRAHSTLDDGARVFPVTVGDFVSHTNQTCTVECVYDVSNNRWASTQLPRLNSCVAFRGLCRDVSPS